MSTQREGKEFREKKLTFFDLDGKKTQKKTVFPRGMLRSPHRLPGLLPHRLLLLPEDAVQGEALEVERGRKRENEEGVDLFFSFLF